MKNCVCDKCFFEFEVTDINMEQVCKGDIMVQFFRCPACFEKYHVCTTDSKMRRLIMKRIDLQQKIASGGINPMKPRKSCRLRDKLNRIIARQCKMIPELEKQGAEILNGGD